MRRTKRIFAAALAGIMACSCWMTGYAASLSPACDETMYITLDEEGNIEESSVVKRYDVKEDGQITDYGTYEKISNLTTNAQAVANGDGSYSFPVSADDGAFYFEGKTAVKEEELPWTIRVKYLLNGVETPAEKLAGEKGLVEIQVDLLPNKLVSAYYRNNMSLIMSTMVNMDDALSVRAEGAQVQTVGNMSAVIFVALPGEECHYTVAIGSDDFEFTGLIFMMVPLTLSQLDQVSDLKDAKETLEDSKDALSDSLDVLLDTMEQMQTGIADTASGLRGLDNAREIIHSSRDDVYAKADAALEQLDGLAESLKPFKEHTDRAQNALTEVRGDINNMTYDINELEPKLGDLKDTVRYLRDDIGMIQDMLGSPQMDYASQTFLQLLEKTKNDLLTLSQSQANMSQSIGQLGQLLASLQKNGASLEESAALLASLDLDTDYDADEMEELLLGIQDNVELYNDLGTQGSGEDGSNIAGGESRILADASRQTTSNWTIPPEAEVALGQLIYTTTDFTGNNGIEADLAGMISLTQQVLAALEAQEKQDGAMRSAVHETKDLLTNIGKISQVAEDICSDIDELNQTLEKYHEDALSTLADMGRLTDQTAAGVESLSSFFKTLENQVKSAGGSLDEGTKATLNGLADVLDHAGTGLNQTGILRNAKDTIIDTIDDKWDEFSEEHTTILDIDLEADPVSLTSDKNPSPHSMQIILRTKEITKDDDDNKVEIDETYYPEGNIFHRIGMIFKRIWEAICSLFG